ncbi:MAG: hypothetical protein JWM33_2860 [Caulobacteraceae bacterium]|nr:hypothetical protein [Caulobacteraceae bacterium]
MTKTILWAVILGGLIARALDITYACVHYGLVYGSTPQRIFQSVAAGVMGKDAARAGGWGSAALGLSLHMVMTIIMAAVFVMASRAAPVLNRWPLASAIVYGLGLFVVMNCLVVPHSAAGDGTVQLPKGQFLYGSIFAHIVLVALPITLMARRARNVSRPG